MSAANHTYSSTRKIASAWATLELPTTASLQDVRQNYKRLALRDHPDKNPNEVEGAIQKMVKLQVAFEEVIKQINTRASGLSSNVPPTSKPNPAPWNPREYDPTLFEMAYFKYRAQLSSSTPKQHQCSPLFPGEPKPNPAFANPFTPVDDLPFSFLNPKKPSSSSYFNSPNSHSQPPPPPHRTLCSDHLKYGLITRLLQSYQHSTIRTRYKLKQLHVRYEQFPCPQHLSLLIRPKLDFLVEHAESANEVAKVKKEDLNLISSLENTF